MREAALKKFAYARVEGPRTRLAKLLTLSAPPRLCYTIHPNSRALSLAAFQASADSS
jgi:hypothetical protein